MNSGAKHQTGLNGEWFTETTEITERCFFVSVALSLQQCTETKNMVHVAGLDPRQTPYILLHHDPLDGRCGVLPHLRLLVVDW